MDNSFDYSILLHFFLGPSILFLALAFKIFPPQEPGGSYGYRTPRALLSNETWRYANEHCSNLFLLAALATIGVQLLSALLFEPLAALLISFIVEILSVIAVIPLTEAELKKRFDGRGQRIKSGV